MPLVPEPWNEERPSDEISNIVDPYFGGFDLIQGNPVEDKIPRSETLGAGWRNGVTGNLAEILTGPSKPKVKNKDYNVYDDIPARHFDPSLLHYYVNSMSSEETENISLKVDKEQRDNAVREEYPWTSMAAGVITDPLFFFLPGAAAGRTLKASYELAVQAGLAGAKISAVGFAKEVGKAAIKTGAATFGQEGLNQALIQQTHITKSIADSYYDMGISSLWGAGFGALGAIAVGAASIKGIRNAKSQAVNAAADIPDVPTIMPTSKMEPGTSIRPGGAMGPDWPLRPDGGMPPVNPTAPNGTYVSPISGKTYSKPKSTLLDPEGSKIFDKSKSLTDTRSKLFSPEGSRIFSDNSYSAPTGYTQESKLFSEEDSRIFSDNTYAPPVSSPIESKLLSPEGSTIFDDQKFSAPPSSKLFDAEGSRLFSDNTVKIIKEQKSKLFSAEDSILFSDNTYAAPSNTTSKSTLFENKTYKSPSGFTGKSKLFSSEDSKIFSDTEKKAPVEAQEIKENTEQETNVEKSDQTVGAMRSTPETLEQLTIQRIVPEQVITVEPITAAVMESNNRVARVPVALQHLTKFSISNQMLVSSFATSPYVSRLLFSNPLMSVANIQDNMASPRALDDRIFGSQQRLWIPAQIKINQIFMRQQGIENTFLSGARSRIANAMTTGESLNRDQFHFAIFDSLNTNVRSQHAAVNEAVDILRNEVMRPLKEDLVSMGMLHPRFLEPAYDAYFHRMYNRGNIARNPNEFESLVHSFFMECRDFYRDHAGTIASLQEDANITRGELQIVEQFVGQTPGRINLIMEEIRRSNLSEQEIANITRISQMTDLERNTEITRLNNRMMREMDDLVNFIPAEYMPADGHIPTIRTNEELRISANQTVQRIMGTDIDSAMSLFGPGSGGSDPMQQRVLGMPNNYSAEIVDSNGISRTVIAYDFIEQDFNRVFGKLVRQLVPVIENRRLANELGFMEIADLERFLLESLKADYDHLIQGVQGPRAERLTKEYAADQKRITSSFDIMANVTGADNNAFGPGPAKFLRHIGAFNRVRMLGSAMLSSTSELGMGVFRQGFDSLILDQITPFIRSILTMQRNRASAINSQDARILAFCCQTEVGKIAKALQNNDELLIHRNWWGNISEPMVNMLGNVSMVNQLTDLTQNMNFNFSISKTMRSIVRQAEGRGISNRNRRRLRSIGIEESDVPIIHEMWNEVGGHNTGRDGTVYCSNMNEWKLNTPERNAAYLRFRDAVVKDVRQSQSIGTAGDKWRHHNNSIIKPMLDFKDFLFAANNKIFLNLVQKLGLGEMDVILSTMYMMALSGLGYILVGLSRDPTGESLDVTPRRLFFEMMDRASMLGVWGEIKNMGTKWGALPEWMGPEVSRFNSRGKFSTIAGPTYGTGEDLIDFMAFVKQHLSGEKNMTQADINKLLKFLPYQNLFYLRYVFQKAAEGLGEALGAEES